MIQHGGALDRAVRQHGGRRQDWLDLSTGINPLSWPAPRPVPEVCAEAWQRLPGSDAEARLIAAARHAYGVPEALDIVPAPGTQALIQALPRLLAGRTATIIAGANGTYGEHAHCCAMADRAVRTAASPGEVAGDERLAILVNPNNPDGYVWAHEALIDLAERLRARDGFLVVDEAFCDVVPEASIISAAVENVIVLRSFGKFFGLAGLRLGFAVTSPGAAGRIRDWFGPWAVCGPALMIGAAALSDEGWIAATRNRLEDDSLFLANMLEDKGFSISGRTGLFVLASHDGAGEIADELARRHILVRSFVDRPTLLRFGLCAGEHAYERLGAALAEGVK